MKLALAILVVGFALVGCEKQDAGELPPPTKPMTQAELDAMPPQARAAMENAQKRGAEMAQNRGINGGQ